MKKAIFLDKDGVLVEETGNTLYKKEDMKIIDGVKVALKELKKRNYLLLVVSNQAAIARGLITEKGVKDMNEILNKNLDCLIDSFYYCPHHPEMHDDVPLYARKYRIKCNCRKPLPGMILNAAKDFDIDLKNSYMIGDMISDIIAGKSAGCKTILIDSVNTGKLIKSHINMDLTIKPDFYSKSLLESLRYID